MNSTNNNNSESEDEIFVDKKSGLIAESSESVIPKNQLKSPHTIHSFDKWINLSSEFQIDERIQHFKHLLEETELRVQTRDEMITTLQNQLKKIENMCRRGFENTEHYRFKYCVVSNELENLRKICSQYKENIDNLIKINEELTPKEDLLNAQREVQSWKLQYEELSKTTQLKKISKANESTQADLDKPNIQKDLNLLKQQCSNIEDILKIQNYTIDQLILSWMEEFEKMNKQNADSANLTEGTLNNIATEAVNQNDNLQIILNDNKSITAEILSLKQHFLQSPLLDKAEAIVQCNCECKPKNNMSRSVKEIQTDDTKHKNEDLLEQIEYLKKISTQSNQSNEATVKNLYQTVEDIQNEKLKIATKYEELRKRNNCADSELQCKTVQLNNAIDEINKLKNKMSELQLLVEALNQKNENCSACVGTNAKFDEFEEMQQLLQQYKEQVEFKKLENEKLCKKEQELQLELHKIQYDAEQAGRECALEVNKRKAALLQLQKQFDDLTSASKEKESKLIAEKDEALNLVDLKNKEIQNLQSQASILHSNLSLVQSDLKKIENQNNKSLTEISFLFKHKESQWFEISHKFKEQEDYVADLEDENMRIKEQFKELQEKLELGLDKKDNDFLCPMCRYNKKPSDNLRLQLLYLLHNMELTLMKILEEDNDINLPSNTADEFLFQTRQFIAILEQRRHVDLRASHSESSLIHKNVFSKKHNRHINCDSVIATQTEDFSELVYKSSTIDNSDKDTKLWKTMKQMLVELEELKKEIKGKSSRKSDEGASLKCNPNYDIKAFNIAETIERSLDAVEEVLETQLHDDDSYPHTEKKRKDEETTDKTNNDSNIEISEEINVLASRSYTLEQPCGKKRPCAWRLKAEQAQHQEDKNYSCPCSWCVQQQLHPYANRCLPSSTSKGCNRSTCSSFKNTQL